MINLDDDSIEIISVQPSSSNIVHPSAGFADTEKLRNKGRTQSVKKGNQPITKRSRRK
jgi:hypothetical protein